MTEGAEIQKQTVLFSILRDSCTPAIWLHHTYIWTAGHLPIREKNPCFGCLTITHNDWQALQNGQCGSTYSHVISTISIWIYNATLERCGCQVLQLIFMAYQNNDHLGSCPDVCDLLLCVCQHLLIYITYPQHPDDPPRVSTKSWLNPHTGSVPLS